MGVFGDKPWLAQLGKTHKLCLASFFTSPNCPFPIRSELWLTQPGTTHLVLGQS